MEVSPTSVQREYVHGNATGRNANETSGPGTNAAGQYDWIEILTLVISSFGLPGNITVLWLLGFRIRRNPFSIYILNLAASDFLLLFATFVFHVETYSWDIPTTLGTVYVLACSYYVGLGLLTAISTERCLSVLFPIWYRCHRPKHTSASVCAIIWALAGLLTVGFHFACRHLGNHGSCDAFSKVLAALFFLLFPVLCVTSLTLLLRVHCSSQRRQPPRLYGVVLLTVLVFVICALPLGVVFLVPSLSFRDSPWLCLVLACVNSSANPFIYFFMGSQMRRRGREPLRVVLQRALGGEEDLEHERRDTSHNSTWEMSS